MPSDTSQSHQVGDVPHSAAGNFADFNEVSVGHLLDLLRSGKKTIAIVAVGVFILGALYAFLASPTYRADGLVQVEENSKNGSLSQMSDISSLLLGSPVETEAEIQILRSRMVLNQVIDKMNLLIAPEPRYFPFVGRTLGRINRNATEPLSAPWIFRRYAWGGEKFAVSSFDVPESFLGKPFELKKTDGGYELLSPDGESLLEGKIGESATVESKYGRISIFVKDLVAQSGTQFRLTRFSQQDALDSLSKHLTVAEQGKQSGVILIAFEGRSPEYVSTVVNNIEEAYLRQNVERRSADAEQSLQFLQAQLPQLKERVDISQAKLNEYQLKHQSVDVTKETELVLQQGVGLDTQRMQLQQQRDEALQRFTAQHPVVKALNEQIQTLDAAQADVKKQFEKLPTTQQEIASLLRDQDVSTVLYTQMLNSVQELQISKAGTIGNVRIIDHSLRPFRQKSPNVPVVLLLSVIFGLILGSALVVVQRALLRGVDDPSEVEARFGLITYAMIPYSAKQRRLNQALAAGKKDNFILAKSDGDDVAVESLRSLRTSLHFALLESRNNVVMLTGPAPNLGKSFVSINLGAVLALSGKKVVVVDADMRMGHLHRFISSPVAPGLADYIVGDSDLSAIAKSTTVDGLDVICRGTLPPNPAELLMHERFAELVRVLSSTYDYVILDTPPVLAVADAAIVGRLAGSTLVVLKAAQHPMREIEETLKRLNAAGVAVRGTLFNQVGAKAGSYGYGNYGYTYYQYGKN